MLLHSSFGFTRSQLIDASRQVGVALRRWLIIRHRFKIHRLEVEKLWNGLVVDRSGLWHRQIRFVAFGKLTGTTFHGSVDCWNLVRPRGYVTYQRGQRLRNGLARSGRRCRPLVNGNILTLLNFIKLSPKFENKLKSSLLELLTEFKVTFRLLGTVTCRLADRQYLI